MNLTLNGPMRVVCLAAHPDDVELGCGGLLLALSRREGSEAGWLTLTGTPERVAEARAAAEAFWPGSRSRFAGLPDGRLPSVWGRVKEELHAFAAEVPEPDLVLAPRTDDAHQDHRLVGRLASTVWRSALIAHYEIPKRDGDLGRPNVYVPLSPVEARAKVDLLDRSYPSQAGRDWWDRELFLGLARLRGVEAGARYAEGLTVPKAVWAIEGADV